VLGRGFDITDEAYYVLLAMHADSVSLYISAQQWITSGLWQLTGSLVMFRASGLFILFASAVILSSGVSSVCIRLGLMENRLGLKAVVHSCSIVFALLYAATINLSPCYNLLASSGAYAAAGMVLLATTHSKGVYKYSLYFLAGCAVGLEALSKPSSGISTLILLSFLSVYFERFRVGKVMSLLMLFLGAVFAILVCLYLNTTVSNVLHAFEQGMQLFRMVQVESITSRLLRYFAEFGSHLFLMLKVFAIPIAAVIIYVLTRSVFFFVLGLLALMAILLFGSLDAGMPTYLLNNITSESFIYGGFRRYEIQITALFALLLMVLAVSGSLWGKHRSLVVLFLGLILLPYSVVMGTGNAMFTQVLVSLAPWGALVGVLVVAAKPEKLNEVPIILVGALFALTAMSQILTSALRPYHLPTNRLEQNRLVSIGGLGEVKVDEGTQEFLEGMKAAAIKCDIKPKEPFFGIYNIPGVALALQSTPPLTPWINNSRQAEFIFDRVAAEHLEPSVVAIQIRGGTVKPSLPRQLNNFPDGYQYCGSAIYPFDNSYDHQLIQIWKN